MFFVFFEALACKLGKFDILNRFFGMCAEYLV